MHKGASLPVASLLAVSIAWGEDPVVRWRDVVGLIQPGNIVGSGTGAITGGGQPWVTSRGFARVNLTTGGIQFAVRGLVLVGGNSIGTRGDITEVRGALVCDTNGSAGGGNSVIVQTDAVALSPEGDAHFSGNLGSLPAVCSSEADLAFLVRIAEVNGAAVNGPWIAAGVVRETRAGL